LAHLSKSCIDSTTGKDCVLQARRMKLDVDYRNENCTGYPV
jgi:hypothetical protein